MKHTDLDKQYYVLNVDGEDNHPTLEWGDYDDSLFLDDSPIDTSELELPIEVVFDDPYPSKYTMPDFLMLGSSFACTEKVKNLFEKSNVYGVEFFPIDKITDNKSNIIEGYFAMHIWNIIEAIDKLNYIGEKPNRKGHIFDIEKFSLDQSVLQNIPIEQRLIFELKDSPAMYIIHESIFNLISKEDLTGFAFFRVDDWDDDAMFR